MSSNPSDNAYASNVYVPGQTQASTQPYVPAQQATHGTTSTSTAAPYVPPQQKTQANPLMAQFRASQQAQKEEYIRTHSPVQNTTTNPTTQTHTVPKPVPEEQPKPEAEPPIQVSPKTELPKPSTEYTGPPKPPAATTYTGPPKPPAKPTTTSTTSTSTSTSTSSTANYGGSDEASFRKEFAKVDLDGSGFIDQKELSKLCMGMVPDNILKKAMKFIDTNKDGKISVDEYIAIRKQIAKFIGSK